MTPYITETNADLFFESKLDAAAWDNETSTRREKALKEATRRIDKLNYIGERTDATQENEFPRGGDTEIPRDIQYACALIALSLLDGVDTEQQVENLRLTSQGISSIRATFDSSYVPEYLIAGIPNHEAWLYLQPYLRAGQDVTIQRAS